LFDIGLKSDAGTIVLNLTRTTSVYEELGSGEYEELASCDSD
jgi:hypothetical protein